MSQNNYIKNNENAYYDYYVSFKTTDKDRNITIIPNITMYDTLNRNLIDEAKTFKINKEGKTILTNPDNKEYVFVQMAICSSNSAVRYEFKNAFNGRALEGNGEIQSNSKFKFKKIPNIKLDTELIIKTDYKDVDMFIKHTGFDDKDFNPNVKPITIEYKDKKIIFTQPIVNEQFKYTLYIDKKDNIRNKKYTLCSFADEGRFAPLTIELTTAERAIKVDFDIENNKELEEYKLFDVLILAKEIDKGKLWILSDIYSNKPTPEDPESKQTRTALIVVIIVLSVICILGGVAVFLYVRKLKSQPRGAIIAKPTDFSDLDGMNQEKLVESMSKSVAMETA